MYLSRLIQLNDALLDDIVEAITIIDAPQIMHNLTVALVANYLVGEGQWVVHNVNQIIDGIPIGYTEESWGEFLRRLDGFNQRFQIRLRFPVGEFIAHGSRVAGLYHPDIGPASFTTDLDLMLRLEPKTWDQYSRFIGDLMNNPNSRTTGTVEVHRQMSRGQIGSFTLGRNAIDPDYNVQFFHEFFTPDVRPNGERNARIQFSILRAESVLDTGFGIVCDI